MKKDVTNAGKNTDDYNVWKSMSLMAGKKTDDYNVMKKDVTNGGKNTDDYNVWKRMPLMEIRILMIIMYGKRCH